MINRSPSLDRPLEAPDPPQATDPLLFLDGLRGLTAVYVMIYHSGVLWEGFGSYLAHPQLYSLPEKILAYVSLLFNYGHQVVWLFFILSGFVIHLRYARQAQTQPPDANRFDSGAFFWRRFKRIYPPLLWAIVLTFVLDHSALLVSQVSYDPVLPRLISTLLLIPGPAPEWGSNLPLWSLRLEWWFYLLYPFIWRINRRSFGMASGIIFLLFISSLFEINIPGNPLLIQAPLQIAQSIFSFLIIWWMGALLAEIYVGRVRIRFGWLAPLAIGLIPLLITQFDPPPLFGNYPQIEALLWGLGLTGLFAALFAWKNRGGSLRWLERLKPLGNMSYTLYITHWPILVWMQVIIVEHSPAGAPQIGYESVIPGILLCLGAAYLAHFVVEKPFQRRRISSPESPSLPGTDLPIESSVAHLPARE